jgi:hypothetical protein
VHLDLLSFACAGHVLLDLPVFGGPVLMLVGWILYVIRRDRSSAPELRDRLS